jgi:exonuclease VII large subunit
LDGLVSELVLKALEPAALEISLKVAEDVEAERQRLHQHWAQRLERARYEAERASRQYHAVEPENRLVARTLERHWEEALAREETVKAEYARFLAQQPPTLSAQERRFATSPPISPPYGTRPQRPPRTGKPLSENWSNGWW